MSKDLSLAELRELRLRALQARSEKKNDIEIAESESQKRRMEKSEVEETRLSPRKISPRVSPKKSSPRRSSSPKRSSPVKRKTIFRRKTSSSSGSSSSDSSQERYGTSSRKMNKRVTKTTKVVPSRRRITQRKRTSTSSESDSSPERTVSRRRTITKKQVVPRKNRPNIRVKKSSSPKDSPRRSPSPRRSLSSRRSLSPVRVPSPRQISPRVSPRVSPIRKSETEAILTGFVSTGNISGLNNYLNQNASNVDIREIATLFNEARTVDDLETINTIIKNKILIKRLLILFAEDNNVDSFEYVFNVSPGVKAHLGKDFLTNIAKINNTSINQFLSKWYGRTLFDYYNIRIAIQNNNLAKLRNIAREIDINLKIENADFPENLDNNVLNWAVYNDASNEMIEFIIDQGVDVNIYNSQALILAVAMNNLRITRLLVRLGANYRDHEFELFARAIKYSSVEMIEYLKTIIDYRPMASEIIKFINEEELDPLIEYFID